MPVRAPCRHCQPIVARTEPIPHYVHYYTATSPVEIGRRVTIADHDAASPAVAGVPSPSATLSIPRALAAGHGRAALRGENTSPRRAAREVTF